MFDKERTEKAPHWGKNAVPDEYVDLGMHDRYELDLQKWAPPEWDGQVWFGLMLQQSGANTSMTTQLVPLAKQSQEAGTPQAKGAERPTDAPPGSTKDKKD